MVCGSLRVSVYPAPGAATIVTGPPSFEGVGWRS